MAGGVAAVSERLGIVELHGVCAAMRARNEELFRTLGGWVTSTPDGPLQRLFAEACHRHAWHAELWARRTPAIPIASDSSREAAGGDGSTEPSAGDGAPADVYRAALVAMLGEVEQLRSRVDPVLDPATARTVELVARDLDDLRRRLDA